MGNGSGGTRTTATSPPTAISRSGRVKAGQKVSAGRQLGKVGAIGNATGPQLHFEMSKGSTWSYGGVARHSW